MPPKRPSSPEGDGDSSFKAPANTQRERSGRAADGIDERGEFEDQWEDEFEEEEVDFDNEEDDDDDDSHLGGSRETGMEGDVDGQWLLSRFFSHSKTKSTGISITNQYEY
jgi:ribosome assembly protein RRB1